MLRCAFRRLFASPGPLPTPAPPPSPPRVVMPAPVSLMTTKHVRVSAFVDGAEPLGFGTVLGHDESDDTGRIFRVKFDSIHKGLPEPLEVLTVVWVQSPDRARVGIVAKVNNDCTYGVLFDEGLYEPVVAHDRIVSSEGKSILLQTERFRQLLAWIQGAGVERKSDAELAALSLCKAGWRKEKLYLLKEDDVKILQHLHRSTRACILEMADWECEKVRVIRDADRERQREKEWGYFIVKFAGVVSTVFACTGVCSVFFWNFLNYRRNRRSYQMDLVIQHCTKPLTGGVVADTTTHHSHMKRQTEVESLQSAMQSIDSSHPRTLVVLGPRGVGKSSLVRSVLHEKKGNIIVSVRMGWNYDDLSKAIVRAMGVENVEACGDHTTFIYEALTKIRELNGAMPTIVFSLRLGENYVANQELAMTVFNQQRLLSKDLGIASTVSEIDDTRVSINPTLFSELDFHRVGEFTPEEARDLMVQRLSSSDISYAIRYLGCAPGVLDLMISHVNRKQGTVKSYVDRAILEGAMVIEAYKLQNPETVEVLRHLSRNTFESGVGLARYPSFMMGKGVPNPIFHVDWASRSIVFNNRVLHSAGEKIFSSSSASSSWKLW